MLVATGQFDNWYNLSAGTKTDYNGNISTIELTSDHRATAAITLGTDRETYDVNEFGQIVRHTAIDGVETSQTYNGVGFLATRSIGPLTTTYGYANLTGGVSDPGLRGLPSIITDPKGNQTTRIYDERNQLVRESRGGVERTYAYDVGGRVTETTTIVDTNRVLVGQQSYNQFGFLTARTLRNVEVDGAARDLTVRYVPDLFNRVKEIDWPSGQRDLIEYDALERVSRYTIEGDYAESYGYDGNGNLTTLKIGPSTQPLVYDGHDRLIRHITPMGTVVQLGLDGNGNVLSKVVLDGRTNLLSAVTNSVDVLNRVRTTTRLRNNGSSTMRYNYNSTNRTMVVTDALGAVVTNFYDNVGRLERTAAPTLASRFSYDANGNQIEVETQEGGRTYITQYGYNALDQLISITNNLGDVSQRLLGLDGRLLQFVDRQGNRTTNSYRLTGELLATAAPTGVRIDYSYATNNQLDSIRDPSANASTYIYDAQSRLLQVKLPDNATTTFTNFNQLAVPTVAHMPRGITVESAFDLEDKLTNRVISGFGPARAETYQYDGMQRLVRVTDPSGEMDFTYDLFGFIREIGQRYQFTTDPAPTNNLTFSVQQDADAGGFRSRVIYPYSSVVITNRRDQVGRLLALVPSQGEPIVQSTVYSGDSLVGQQVLGENRILCEMEYDGLQRPILRRYSRASDGKVLTDIRYSYDREGAQLVRQFVDRSGRADMFAYDGGYRLKRADLGVRPSLAGAEPVREFPEFSQPPSVPGAWAPGRFARAMTYSATDVLHEIALLNPDNLPTPLSASTFGAPDAMSFVSGVDGFTRTRDEVGNVTRTRLAVRLPGAITAEWVGANLSYDDLGQLVKIERDDGVVVLNEFGPDGLRMRRKITGDPTRCVPSDIAYLYDSGRLIEERDLADGAAVLARYYYGEDGDELIAGDFQSSGSTNPTRLYFLTDALRSVLAVADSSGNVVERMGYDAWGQPTLQARDESAPRVARAFLETNSLLIEFSEPVLPAFAEPVPSTNLVTALRDPNLLFQVTVGGQPVSGRVRFEENLPGHLFGSVFRFIADQPMSGTVQLTVSAGAVQDEWNNTNPQEVINLDLAAANPLYSGPAPGSSAPTELGRSSVNSSFLFHGQYFDYDSGLLYCRARFYDPHTGMFLQPDPAGYTDGVDHYAGFAHNPINLRDPTGTATDELGQRTSNRGGQWVELGKRDAGITGFIEKTAGYGMEGVGAVLQLGTGTAEGFDLLNSKRPGSWGVLDRIHGSKLVISDAMTAANVVNAARAAYGLYAAGRAAYNSVRGRRMEWATMKLTSCSVPGAK
ncbi:MAG: hypothetical protein DME22_15370 [Verrucomicrobia bacterium]|nr:MAG: hypothetical protein DME22_15370 [Verrucomicrobiota bacterium]